MKILVVRLTSMGDVVLTLPAVNDILTNCPGAEIDWLVEKPFAPIVRMHPGVNRVIEVSWRKWRKTLWKPDTRLAIKRYVHELREARYDLIIDFQGQVFKSILLAAPAKGPLLGFAAQGLREPLSSLFYRRKGEVPLSLHLVPRSRQLAAALLGYVLPVSPASYGISVESIPAPPYAVIIPCASRAEKLWPEERWHAVGKQLKQAGLQVSILWGSSAELELANRLSEVIGAAVPGFLTVAQAAGLLSGATLVVGLDTGFTHLAAALKVPTVGIYCDFEPAKAGLVSGGFAESHGGIGMKPPLDTIQASIRRALSYTHST